MEKSCENGDNAASPIIIESQEESDWAVAYLKRMQEKWGDWADYNGAWIGLTDLYRYYEINL